MTGKHVLVVDDEPLILNLAEMVLTDHGYKVSVASSGMKALRLCGSRAFDCVVTDILMPGMTGPELVRDIEAQFGEVPILLMSGLADVPDFDLNAYPLLKKPFVPSQLVNAIESVIATKVSRAGMP